MRGRGQRQAVQHPTAASGGDVCAQSAVALALPSLHTHSRKSSQTACWVQPYTRVCPHPYSDAIIPAPKHPSLRCKLRHCHTQALVLGAAWSPSSHKLSKLCKYRPRPIHTNWYCEHGTSYTAPVRQSHRRCESCAAANSRTPPRRTPRVGAPPQVLAPSQRGSLKERGGRGPAILSPDSNLSSINKNRFKRAGEGLKELPPITCPPPRARSSCGGRESGDGRRRRRRRRCS